MLNLLQSDVKTVLFTKQDLISESHSVPVKIATGDIDGGPVEELDCHLVFVRTGISAGKLLIVPDDPVTITKGPSDLPFEQFSTKKCTSVKNRKWIDIQYARNSKIRNRMCYLTNVPNIWVPLNGDPIDLLEVTGYNKGEYELCLVSIESVMLGTAVTIKLNAGLPLEFDGDEEFVTVQYPVFISDPKVVHEPVVDAIYGIIDTKNKIARLHSVNRIIDHIQFGGFVVEKEQTNADKNKD